MTEKISLLIPTRKSPQLWGDGAVTDIFYTVYIYSHCRKQHFGGGG